MQTCRICKETKPLTEYHWRNDSKKYHTKCKDCWTSDQMARNYGITLDEYERRFAYQNGVCAICSLPQNSTRNQRLCVDHDHDTGAIRGLLCDTCNRGIGLLKDDARILDRAALYLRSTQQ
jgi:hypothetical protein